MIVPGVTHALPFASCLAQARFHLLDWGVVAAYLVFTTVLGAKLAGKQATIRDFFLGGRKLPWWAVCGSTIATEISTATFVVVPAIVFAAGGNLTYLQLAIGSVLARFIVGWYFVPRFYEEEIYSPYDYVGRRLGPRVKTVTTALFLVGAVLGQGGRLFTAAFMVSIVADLDLVSAIWLMGAFSVLWAMIGGITMVIWTDVIQFCILLLGAVVALGFALHVVPGGISEAVRIGREAGKFQFFDFSTDLSVRYTFWCGLLATSFSNLAAFGTDQVMAQRMFCCRDARDARRSIVWSSVSIGVALLMMMLGIALYAYFQHAPFTSDEAARYAKHQEYLLPIFIVRALPIGVRGLIVAAVLAAAVSTLESALAALSQTTVRPLMRQVSTWRGTTDPGPHFQGELGVSKALVFVWGMVLCGMATACIGIARNYQNAIDLVLAFAGYSAGPLLGIFLLAFLKHPRDDRGLPWAVAVSILAVFAVSVREPWADKVVFFTALILAGIIPATRELSRWHRAIVVLFIMAAAGLHWVDGTRFPRLMSSGWAFPWTYPLGTLITFGLGYVLGRPRIESHAIQDGS